MQFATFSWLGEQKFKFVFPSGATARKPSWKDGGSPPLSPRAAGRFALAFAWHISRLMLIVSYYAACHAANAADAGSLQYFIDPEARAEADRLMRIVVPETEGFVKYELDRRAAVIGNPDAVLSFCRRADFGGYVDPHQLDSVAVCRATISALSNGDERKHTEALACLTDVMRKIARSEEAMLLLAHYDARAKFDVEEPWRIAARRADDDSPLPYFEDNEAKKQAERLMERFNSSPALVKARNMNEAREMTRRDDLLRRAAEIGIPTAVRRMCVYDPSRYALTIAEGVAFCQAVQHRIPDSEPDLQQWVQSNLDKAKPYIAEHPNRILTERYRVDLHERWQAREEMEEEALAAEAQYLEGLQCERQMMIAELDPTSGAATSTAALTAFMAAVEKQDGKTLDKLADPLRFEPPVMEQAAAFASEELKRDLFKCRIGQAGPSYRPSEDQIAKGPAQDMAHLYAPIRAQCEKDSQPRVTYVDLIQIKGRWYVDFWRVPK